MASLVKEITEKGLVKENVQTESIIFRVMLMFHTKK